MNIPIYPTQKAVAFKVTYSRNWKCGNPPERTNLGFVLFPVTDGIEDADRLVRRAFPDANQSRLYDECGNLYCSGTI